MLKLSTLLFLSFQSIKNRKLITFLSITTIALSVTLILGVELIRKSAQESFKGTISGTDLIVGPRSSPLQLLLYTVFHMGSPVSNISIDSMKHFENHPEVKWVIPISLGDSHRGFRVVATNENFYKYFMFRKKQSITFTTGKPATGVFDVVIGSDVARSLHYQMGDRIVLSHGIGGIPGIMDHKDKPFTITGILEQTSTPIDRSLYISLEGMEAIHMDWKDGAPPLPGEQISREEILKKDIKVNEITAFFLGTRMRISSLRLQREINDYKKEAIMGVLPGVTLSEFWRSVSYGENALLLVLVFAIVSSFAGVLMTIYATLNERRREMSILRSLGAGPGLILSLFVMEAGMLTLAGAITGTGFLYMVLLVIRPFIEKLFGFYLELTPPGLEGMIYLGMIIGGGFLMGLFPAWRAYRNALNDGLTIKI